MKLIILVASLVFVIAAVLGARWVRRNVVRKNRVRRRKKSAYMSKL